MLMMLMMAMMVMMTMMLMMVMMMNVYAYNGVFNHGDGDVSRKPPIALSAIARTHKPFPDCDDCEDVTILTMIMMM